MATIGGVLLCEEVRGDGNRLSLIGLTDRFMLTPPSKPIQIWLWVMVRADTDRSPCTLTFQLRSHGGGQPMPLHAEETHVDFRPGSLGSQIARRLNLEIMGSGWCAIDVLVDGTPSGYVDFEVVWKQETAARH